MLLYGLHLARGSSLSQRPVGIKNIWHQLLRDDMLVAEAYKVVPKEKVNQLEEYSEGLQNLYIRPVA